MSTAFTTAAMISPARHSSCMMAEPQALLVTFLAGQPKLMSMTAAPRSWFSRAASAMTAGSRPASCPDSGNSAAQSPDLLRDSLPHSPICRIIAVLELLSNTPSPTTDSLTRLRLGTSDNPDHGARGTGGARLGVG